MVVRGQRRPRRRPTVAGFRGNWWVLVIAVLALALRVVYLIQAREHLYFNGFSDSLYYHEWAQRIIQGKPGLQVFYMGPLYPYLLAFFYRIFGPRPEAVLWFQVLLGSASCVLIYHLGRMVFGRKVGLLAALMGALYAVEIFYEGALLMAVTLYALNLLLLASIFWVLQRKRWFLWIIPGLLLGFSALGRASVLSFLPFLMLGVFLLVRARGERGGLSSLAVFLGVFLVLAPVTVHNVVVGHDLVLITSNFGLNFFVGNNPDAHGYYEPPKGLDLSSDIYGAKIAGIYMGRRLKPSEVSRFWFQKALAFVRTQPGAFLRLMLSKFLFFWNGYEIPQVEHQDFFKKFAPVLSWPLLGFSILGPLGLLGMALGLGSWKETYFLLTFILSLMGTTVLFFVLSRLRLQVCSVLMVFAAYALVWLWGRLRARQIRQLAVALLALASLTLLVNWPHPGLNPARDLAQSQRFLALHLQQKGDLDGASREYERAVAIYPQLGGIYVDLATLRLQQGQAHEALNLYKKALQVDPQVSGVHLNLGRFYAQQGLWNRAIAEFRAETKASPYDLKALEDLYRALQESEKLPGGQPPEK